MYDVVPSWPMRYNNTGRLMLLISEVGLGQFVIGSKHNELYLRSSAVVSVSVMVSQVIAEIGRIGLDCNNTLIEKDWMRDQ